MLCRDTEWNLLFIFQQYEPHPAQFWSYSYADFFPGFPGFMKGKEQTIFPMQPLPGYKYENNRKLTSTITFLSCNFGYSLWFHQTAINPCKDLAKTHTKWTRTSDTRTSQHSALCASTMFFIVMNIRNYWNAAYLSVQGAFITRAASPQHPPRFTWRLLHKNL